MQGTGPLHELPTPRAQDMEGAQGGQELGAHSVSQHAAPKAFPGTGIGSARVPASLTRAAWPLI